MLGLSRCCWSWIPSHSPSSSGGFVVLVVANLRFCDRICRKYLSIVVALSKTVWCVAGQAYPNAVDQYYSSELGLWIIRKEGRWDQEEMG